MMPVPNDNPYSAPTVEEETHKLPHKQVGVDFSVIILRWERLRIYYNAILAIWVILLAIVFVPQHAGEARFWIAVLTGAVIANACYFAGPLIEGYGMFFRKWNSVCTAILFLAGLAFCAVLAAGCVVSYPI